MKVKNEIKYIAALPRCKSTTTALHLAVRAPDWLLERDKITQRQWRQMKRRDLKNLIAAFDEYRLGSAYCPNKNGEVEAIRKLLNDLKESHSIKKWGR